MMMQKLSKDQLASRDALAEELADLYGKLEVAVEIFNNTLSDAWDAVENARDTYNAKLFEANQWLEEVADAIQEYIDERGDKWQASEKGEAYDTWHAAFDITLEEIDLGEPDWAQLRESDRGQDLPELPESIDLA
jgi:hypothetical protein